MTDATGQEGETVSVTADIENTGDSEDTKTAELVVSDGVGVVDSQTLTLAPGELATRVLQWDTAAGDAGSYDVTVETADDTATQQVTVELGDVVPTITSTNSPVKPGETLDVTADIENTGSAQSATVELVVDGAQRDSESLSFSTGETLTRTLSWATADGDAGDYTATVQTADDSASTDVTVGSAVPDSEADSKLRNRWVLDDVASGTVEDSVGSADGTVNGVTEVTGDYAGGAAGGGGGETDDYVNAGTLSWSGSFGNDRAVGLSVDNHSDTTNNYFLFGFRASSGSAIILCSTGWNNSGDIRWVLNDDSSNAYIVLTDSGGHIDDGNPHRVVLNKTANSGGSGLSVYVDQSEVASTVTTDEGFTGTITPLDWYFFARNLGGSDDSHVNAVFDDFCLFDDSLTSSEISSYSNPWE